MNYHPPTPELISRVLHTDRPQELTWWTNSELFHFTVHCVAADV